MELYLGINQLFILQSLQCLDWDQSSATTISMDMEQFLSTQAQGFFWMVLLDRVNTRKLLRRKSFHLESYNCAIQNCQQEETLFHLFLGCPFAERCWTAVAPNRDIPTNMFDVIQDMKQKLNVPFFMEITILATWAIWITRNNFIFQQITPSFQRWKDTFHLELKLLRFRMKNKNAPLYNAWLDHWL